MCLSWRILLFRVHGAGSCEENEVVAGISFRTLLDGSGEDPVFDLVRYAADF